MQLLQREGIIKKIEDIKRDKYLQHELSLEVIHGPRINVDLHQLHPIVREHQHESSFVRFCKPNLEYN
jgi:hypothetical protein